MTEPSPSVPTKKLQGKVAIVTGGASGIGEETARLFAKNGAKVIIADVQDQLGLSLAESIGSQTCTYIHCDVSDEEQVKTTVDWTVKTHGQLDIMFSNAGIFSKSDQTVLDLNLSELDQIFSVNVRGMAACVKHAARAMVDRGVKGSVICTASVAASKGSETWTDYYMSKHSILGLMRCASKQLGKYGIRVNSISPFGVATPMMMNNLFKDKKEFEEMCENMTSLKGISLRVNHVADAVLFLASDDSAFISGHDLVIDGGSTA